MMSCMDTSGHLCPISDTYLTWDMAKTGGVGWEGGGR